MIRNQNFYPKTSHNNLISKQFKLKYSFIIFNYNPLAHLISFLSLYISISVFFILKNFFIYHFHYRKQNYQFNSFLFYDIKSEVIYIYFQSLTFNIQKFKQLNNALFFPMNTQKLKKFQNQIMSLNIRNGKFIGHFWLNFSCRQKKFY